MNKYTKPTAQVVELSVKESLSAVFEKTRKFGFGSKTKEIKVKLYTDNNVSQVDYRSAEA